MILTYNMVQILQSRVARHYSKQRQNIPIIYVKLYMYQVSHISPLRLTIFTCFQLFRSLAYIHGIGICHRDIKPQNLLIDPESGVLKLCDFGSAKYLVKVSESNVYVIQYGRMNPMFPTSVLDTTELPSSSSGRRTMRILSTSGRRAL